MFRKTFAFSLTMAAVAAQNKTPMTVLYESLEGFNLGSMRAFQGNPDDSTAECFGALEGTNAEIKRMLDFTQYSSGEFSLSEMIDNLNVFNIKWVDQQKKCGMDNYVMRWDDIMTNWGNFAGALANLVIQIGVGYNGKDQSVYKGWNLMSEGWMYAGLDGEKDWGKIGEGLSIIMTSIPKVETIDSRIKTDPVD